MNTFLVERYLPSAGVEEVKEDARRVEQVTEMMKKEGKEVSYRGSTLLPGDETCFDLFEASSAQLVMEVNRRAALPFHQVREAVHVECEDKNR
jgi:uncharacterized protein with GYD domain